MKSAVQIMSAKIELRHEIGKILSEEECLKLWRRAESRLNKYLEKYADLPKGVHSHTDEKIFPAAAVYITCKEFMTDEQAYLVIENAAVTICAKASNGLKKAMKIPFMPALFVRMWDPITKMKFGSSCGFKNRFYPKEKGEYRMDILECPYKKYFTELGCPEITKIFCDNDERVYGSLPGLVFERKGTLGKDADRCDFYIRKV
ncbi:L-2-amino-thiazoline-4-carboxylic acid hydrolase [Ruminococcus albus]|uniref:L-2-amino-thiazoline-4-carboxylic acid hydrolase n=1 Tax=Ruminococcus albus TaxID=1264 RepID=A0A1I1CZK1_RUMAL|nr:L-2-amino-thiazoline-4-carboxylic acid hydrolase [Ruminococcus albus]SFB67532.1 L-2-amino-thiazoline-4-carboxylic acid hydrolase [Ruminococcus albus]